MIFRATFKSDLELSTKILVELVSDQIAEQAFCIRPHIKGFCCRRAGSITSSYVPDCIATGFAGGNSSLGKKTQQCWSLFEPNVIDLRVLSGGEVDKAASKPIGSISEALELIGREIAARDFDALHLHTFLPLCIRTKVQPHLLHFYFI